MRTFPFFFLPAIVFSHSIGVTLFYPFSLSFDVNLEFENLNAGLIFTNATPYELVSYLRPFYGDFVFIPKGDMEGYAGNFRFKIGMFDVKDELDIPYPLFLSDKFIDPLSVEIVYDLGELEYRTKWIELYGGRGLNYKSFVFKGESLRFGYQESTVYVDGPFNLYYFSIPAPSFFLQHFLVSNVPVPRGENANTLMGFFIDWKNDAFELYSQILVDDFNTNRFFHPDSFQNPDKIAWSVGGWLRTRSGKFGLHLAGATKYTFENSVPGLDYGYFYYPFYEYENVPIPLEENYVGYIYGENNVTLRSDLEMDDLKAWTEFVLTGSVSPFNPWHEDSSVPSGTHLLDDEKLQKTFSLHVEKSIDLEHVNVSLSADLKWIWNILKRVPAEDGGPDVLKPSDEDVFQSTFSVTLRLGW